MKPVFISNNKLFYSAMVIICVGIIIIGINYNKKEESIAKNSRKNMQNAISVDKKVNYENVNKELNQKKNSKKPIIKKKKIAAKVPAISEESFFENYKIERDRTRDREIELLREIINNPQSDKTTRQDAQKKIFLLTQNLEKEMDIENIIKANGFSNSVVFIHKSGVTVIMQNLNKNNSLIEKEKVKVYEIVSLVTEFKKENIQILFKK